MKTEIRSFCDAFAEELTPFMAELTHGLEAMPEGDEDAMMAGWRRRLRESRHRAETLSAKIAQQHAYLLIFGPLKSGKSTLMNAISGAYISEVSSLPAYPALVYARHGEERAFQATTYAGEKIEFENSEQMAEAVSRGHSELASKILEVERNGESFEPYVHFPEAIRRMDVQTPAEALAESGAALVDTPGLYTRMRFGYDVMTKDFRDNASCAIFVVKSDNLFFEKVFEEFNQLLGCFSRIFLVVNIDSSKRDLSADGSLEPSLESRNPEAIVEAFQSLAMSAPLREAYEKGSLNVYPIDLLKAASWRLKGGAAAETEDGEGPGEGFERFVGDLTEYLNSSDYLREFMLDSLRVGESLQSEIATVVSDEAAESLRREREGWTRRLETANGKLRALGSVKSIDWDAAFAEAREEKDRLLEEYAGKNRAVLGEELVKGLERWLDTDDSLRALRDEYLNPPIEQETKSESSEILERLRQRVDTRTGGARFSPEVARSLQNAGLQPEGIAPGLLNELVSELRPEAPRLELRAEDVPVKRSFLDVVLFRSKKASRERLFGEEGTEFVASAKKRNRIAGKHLEDLREMLMAYPRTDLPEIQQDFANRVLDAYIERFRAALTEQSEALEAELAEERQACEAGLKANGKMQAVFERLAKANRSFGSAVDSLKQGVGADLEEASESEADAAEAEAEANGSDQLALDSDKLEEAHERLKDVAAKSAEEELDAARTSR